MNNDAHPCAGCGAVMPRNTDPDAVCQACDIAAELILNKHLDRAADKIRQHMNEKNRWIFDRMTPEGRRTIVRRLIDRGALQWRVS